MFEIRKSKQAEIDFEDIWLYSYHKWGVAQADGYYDELIEAIAKLTDNPHIGKSRDTLRTDYRSLQVKRHIVYYRVENQIINIIRVLHDSMLPAKHL